MKRFKFAAIAILSIAGTLFMAGCWNYKEANNLAVVAGVAIDKGKNEAYELTVEMIQMSSGNEAKKSSKIISVEGETMFDAARNMIALSGNKLYWAHAKVIIISKEVAEEGLLKTIGWYTRDAETREDVYLLISEESTAKEILVSGGNTEIIRSFDISDMIKNQESLSEAPITDILTYDIESKVKGVSSVIPIVKLTEMEGGIMPRVLGSAIIKEDKLIGFLNGEETKDLLFIRDEVKGGILVEKMKTNDPKDEIVKLSLEIFKNKSKVTPAVENNEIKIKININSSVTIGEIQGDIKFSNEEDLKIIEQTAENSLNKRILDLIKKVQKEYSADIFGFGLRLREKDIKGWKSVENEWENIFGYLEIDVNTKVNIKNSAKLSKPLGEGETK